MLVDFHTYSFSSGGEASAPMDTLWVGIQKYLCFMLESQNTVRTTSIDPAGTGPFAEVEALRCTDGFGFFIDFHRFSLLSAGYLRRCPVPHVVWDNVLC